MRWIAGRLFFCSSDSFCSSDRAARVEQGRAVRFPAALSGLPHVCVYLWMTGCCLAFPRGVTADLVYEFRGTLPATMLSETHPQIAPGEQWLLRVGVDRTVEDTNTSGRIGTYPNAVVAAEVQFSGGFQRSFAIPAADAAERDVIIHDDLFVSGTTYHDGVSVDVRDASSFGILRVSALAFGETPLTALTSESLPLPPRSFAAFPDPAANVDPRTVFFYSDETGRIETTTETTNSITFSAVPEPSALALVLVAGLTGLLLHRHLSPCRG